MFITLKIFFCENGVTLAEKTIEEYAGMLKYVLEEMACLNDS